LKTVIDRLLNRQFSSKKGKKGKEVEEDQDLDEEEEPATPSAPLVTEHPMSVRGVDTNQDNQDIEQNSDLIQVTRQPKKIDIPFIRFISNKNGNFVYFPNSIGIPPQINQHSVGYPAPHSKCSVGDCNNYSVYTSSKANLPLCSFTCYQKVVHNVV